MSNGTGKLLDSQNNKEFLKEYACNIPKCELHLHIEGTLEAEMMLSIAKRNNVALKYETVEEIKNELSFKCLKDFLDLYYVGTSILLTQEDFYDLCLAYLRKAHSENIRHAEIFFDPQSHTKRGVNIQHCVLGLHEAQQKAFEECGITSKLIMCFMRDLPEHEHMKTLEEIKPYIQYITAVGVDSNEINYPCRLLQHSFQEAKKLGLLTVAHAGEEGPVENIIEALEILNVSRIDHGLKCTADVNLVERLIKNKIPITVCPISNEKTQICKVYEHPLLKIKKNNNNLNNNNIEYESTTKQIANLIDRGLQVCINSDDPAYFNGYVNANFIACIEGKEGNDLGWNKNTVFTLAMNSVNASFLTEEEKEKIRQEIIDFDKTFELNYKKNAVCI